jgi:alpha-L-fucosidase
MRRREMIKRTGMAAAVPVLNSFFQPSGYTPFRVSTLPAGKFDDGRDWFLGSKFGMFVHWGIYSIPGWHEQHQWRGRVPRKEYVKLAEKWNPVKFSPVRWFDLLQETGMTYLTVTAKHHDGFCLWDTKETSFNTINTPYGKDIIGMLADECHKRKLPLCIYYSIADWNHPAYPNQGRHHELPQPEEGDNPDWNKYMDFLRRQVKELCSNYGEIHGFWWDMNVPQYKDPSVNEMIRMLQPKAVINNRGFDEGDFGTPERDYDKSAAEADGFDRPTEACQSVGIESWGYKKDEDYYTDRHLMRSIDRYLSRGANYLLNVGPAPDGTIPPESEEILKRIGKWYNKVKESYNSTTTPSLFRNAAAFSVTARDKTVYFHFNKDVAGNGIKLKPIAILPEKATLLNDGRKIVCALTLNPSDHVEQKPYLRIRGLPAGEFADSVMVAKLDFGVTADMLSTNNPEQRKPEWEK